MLSQPLLGNAKLCSARPLPSIDEIESTQNTVMPKKVLSTARLLVQTELPPPLLLAFRRPAPGTSGEVTPRPSTLLQSMSADTRSACARNRFRPAGV